MPDKRQVRSEKQAMQLGREGVFSPKDADIDMQFCFCEAR